MKILIVDDSTIIRRMIESSVGKYGFSEVLQAANGREAIELFEKHKPEIVTLDITMPEVDGIQALGEFKKIHSESNIIVVTALHDKNIAIEAMDLGAVDVLNKPFDEEAFNAILDDIVKGA